jgi:sugar lactone lactonase YvrE
MGMLHKIFRRAIIGVAAVCLLSASIVAHPGSGLAVDRDGQIFFLDTGSGLWRIDAKGRVTRLSPQRFHWLAIDANDGFTQARVPTDSTGDWVITSVGSKPTLLLSSDFPIAIGQDGNLYYPSGRPDNLQLMRTNPAGGTSVFAKLPNATTGAPLMHINGIAAAANDGSIYYTEDGSIRRITAKGSVATVATVTALADGPSIPGIELSQYLRGLNVDAKGVMYVADSGDARVLKITPGGSVTTLLQLESPWAPTDVALHGDVLYILEFLHTPGDDRVAWMPRIRKITPDGKSTVILTVDQMPGARPKPVTTVARSGFDSLFHFEFLNPFLLTSSTPLSRPATPSSPLSRAG